MDIAWVYQRDPEEITVRADEQNKPDIIQYRIDVARDAKVETMLRILNKEGYERVVVFCNTKGMVERATKFFADRRGRGRVHSRRYPSGEAGGGDAAFPGRKAACICGNRRGRPRHRRRRRRCGVQLRRAGGK